MAIFATHWYNALIGIRCQVLATKETLSMCVPKAAKLYLAAFGAAVALDLG